jgi:DegV family protein with EDD domain
VEGVLEMRIGIVTDSTADLPESIVQDYGIEVVPLLIQLGGKTYRDGVDINHSDFYKKLRTETFMPSTSQPAPGVFVECYHRMLERFDQILSIHISGKLSGTVRTANMARETLKAPIEIIDSLSTTMGLGSLVLTAARQIQQGLSSENVVENIKRLRGQIRVLITLNTLEFLQRGGRIGKVAALLGSLLKIKPIIEVVDGGAAPLGKTRSRRNAIKELLRRAAEVLDQGGQWIVSIMHTDALQEAGEILGALKQRYPQMEFYLGEAGPVLGCHVGPEALGIIIAPVG